MSNVKRNIDFYVSGLDAELLLAVDQTCDKRLRDHLIERLAFISFVENDPRLSEFHCALLNDVNCEPETPTDVQLLVCDSFVVQDLGEHIADGNYHVGISIELDTDERNGH